MFKDSHITYFAHKLILSARSDVFNRMFYGAITGATTNGNKIEIVDIEPEIFMELLRFMYTDQINLTEENFLRIIYAAHKYNIEFLDLFCADFLSKILDKNNVYLYLEQCYIYNNAVSEECLLIVDWAINDLITSGKLDDISEGALIAITERDTLKVRELDLFKFIIKWANKYCAENGTVLERKEIKSVIRTVRFPTMPPEDFGECFKLTPDLFTSEEIASVFKFCSSAIRNDNLLFSTTKREYGARFNNDDLVEFVPTKISSAKSHSIQFTVNKAVALSKVRLCMKDVYTDIKICKLELGKSHTIREYKDKFYYNGEITFTPDIILVPNVEFIYLFSVWFS